MKDWLKHLYSDAPDASYGRVLSTLAFLVMILGNLWIMANPWGLLKTLSYVPQINQYLFILTVSGYSITVAKEILAHIFRHGGDPLDQK